MMTPDQLSSLTPAEREGWERCMKATPPGWEVVEIPNPLNELGRERIPNSHCRPELQLQTDWVHPQLKDRHPVIAIWYGPYHERAHTVMLKPEDAAFIAHARTDLPAAYAEIARLREALEKVKPLPEIKAGDRVDHIEGWELPSADDYPVVERVDSENFPEDPVAYFVGGGFWRTSRLKVVPHA